MELFFASFGIPFGTWLVLLCCGVLIGMSKTGVPGVSMIVVPVLATVFGGKPSTGLLLPILIMADVFGVIYYHRHAAWSHLLKALPFAFLGIFIALIVGNHVNDEQFKLIIAVVIFISVGLMLWRGRKETKIPSNWTFASIMGLGGGFATMIGNAAGPIMSIYLLALRLPKNVFIGTAAWFFFIINLSKFPLHIFSWHTITKQTLLMDLSALPGIAIGAFMGIWLVKRIPDASYRWIVLIVTILSAFLMLL